MLAIVVPGIPGGINKLSTITMRNDGDFASAKKLYNRVRSAGKPGERLKFKRI
jgi:hypothetical protein